MTSHVLLGSPTLEEVVTIEIEPEMVKGARVFYPATAGPTTTRAPRS